MADNNLVIKELQDGIRINTESIEQIQTDMQIQFRRAEVTNVERFDLLHEAIQTFMSKPSGESSHGAMNSNKSPFQVRSVKLDFPRFDGKNVLNWIFKAEQFFDYHNTPDPDRLMIASVHLDQDVVPWFQMNQRSHPFRSWQEFTRALELDFGPSTYDCPRAALFKLTQTTSVNDYYKEFNTLANKVYGISNEAFRDCFLSGLQAHIRRDEDEENLDPDPPEEFHTPPTSEETQHHLSLNAMKGNSGMGIIRFTGMIGNIEVQVLVYGESLDTYLQPRIAQFLKVPIEPTPSFQVLVGNGQCLTVEGIVRQLHIQVQGHELIVPTYLLPVAGADLILGSSWLATLGPHIADYANLTLKFYQLGKFITLQGDKQSSPQQSQLHQLRRMQNTNSIAQCFTVQLMEPVSPHDILVELPANIEPELAILLHTYRKVFQTPSGLPPPREHNHEIHLKEGTKPVKVKPYRYPHSQKEEIEKMVHDMLQQGIIKPSNSPFSSPIILVKKKDGSWRFCTDYRALNNVTIKDSFPMPTVDELLDKLHGAQYFSKLDLRSGYHQILIKPEDCYKTAFRTHHGHYEWLVMPFGLTNAPTTFQSLMNKIFQTALRKFVLVFFDDILVYSPSWQCHLQHLEWVLQVLAHHELFAKLSKCSFGQKEVDYLGHIVSGSGVSMDANKVKDVLAWPIPKNVKQLRGFLDLTGYYRRFVKGYAHIASPLTELLKKDAFVWNTAAETTFHKLKQAITTAPVPSLPNFAEPFTLETDASGTDLQRAVQQDEELQQIMQAWQRQEEAYQLYSVKEGLLLWKNKLVIPNNKDIITQILKEFHTSHIGGHAGITRTMARIQAQFYWKNMREDITGYIQHCVICQQAKTMNSVPAGLLQPLPIPNQVWEDVAMDFITRLPNSFGFSVIMVVIDRLTKYSHFMAQKTDYTSKSVAEAFMNQIVKLHGIPKSIVSDRDKVFTSSFWQNLFKLQGTSLAMSTAYHPQTDGQSEALNKCLEIAGMTPFKALYGREAPTLIRYSAQETDLPDVREQLIQREAILNQLKGNLRRAQQVMKSNADKKRKAAEFKVGDMVLVRLQPYRQHSVNLRKNQKLSMRYFGPFKVLARGDSDEPYIPLPLTTSDIGPILLPNKVLDTRMVMQGKTQVPQVLIQWGDEPNADIKWENFQDIKDNYPLYNLEDKVEFKEGGIVMKGIMGNDNKKDDSAKISPTNMEGRRGSRTRIASTRLDGHITSM
ncbi:hypothetical protein TSUD_239070 [Trifolium subterraneum]|uniref:Integrase catalytic domain-containing protein n=1 Tax=Trifolium subterraneum TaxID=3900 RepID=A0A2Z6NLL4_TRISU|nr:hypothetical protein TSUD_239070 [Trifolium subterraneum]